MRDAPGQIACLILSLPIAGLGLLAVFVAFVHVPNWVARPLLEALSTRLGLGIGGIGAMLAGTWMAARILTGKSAPGTTGAARLLGLGVAASLGALGAALLVAAISHQAASTF